MEWTLRFQLQVKCVNHELGFPCDASTWIFLGSIFLLGQIHGVKCSHSVHDLGEIYIHFTTLRSMRRVCSRKSRRQIHSKEGGGSQCLDDFVHHHFGS